MIPGQIVIASCLALAPTLLGVTLGRAISAAYAAYSESRRTSSWDLWFKDISDYTIARRCGFILTFWSIVGALAGGFLCGLYLCVGTVLCPAIAGL